MLKQEQLQREYELLKCQILLNGHLQIICIGTGKNCLAHCELACSKGSGQCREMGNGGKQTLKRVRGREQEDLSPSLPNPAPSPFFVAHFFFAFSQLSEGLLQVKYVHSFISNFLWYIFNLSVEHFWRFVIDQQERIWQY